MEQGTPSRVLTVVEGRLENQKVVDDFKEAAERRGWGFANLSSINSDKLARFDLSDFPLDYVVFRSLSGNNYAESERLLEWLKQNGKIVINGSATGARAATSDKHFQQGLFLLDPFLKKYALPTFEAKRRSNVMSYINGERVHFPIVLKYRYGTAGKGITLVKNEAELAQIQNFNNLLIEQYIEAECDWRVFVIGGTAVGIMRKTGDLSHPENFIAWSAGRHKSLEEDQPTIEELSRIACRTAAVSGLEYTGVDIIRDAKTKHLHLLESNFAAGWMNFIPVTKINIPDLVLDWLEDRAEIQHQPIRTSVQSYIEKRQKYLPQKAAKIYDAIIVGKRGIAREIEPYFIGTRNNYLYDTGTIFHKLSKAYQSLTETDANPAKFWSLIQEIESMPLSWAGNFIGPEVGTLEEGALLSALYLFILGKLEKV